MATPTPVNPMTNLISLAAADTSFNIQFNYDVSVTAAFQAVFETAAARWESIITGDIPDYAGVDDIVINVSIPVIDGVGNILGQSAPQNFRPNTISPTYLPTSGIMQFDVADVDYMIGKNVFDAVILHEMGHVLGLGTMWSLDGLKTGFHYTAINALNAYRELANDPSLTSIPLETNGGAGTAGTHWSELLFDTEIMTGYVDNPMPISAMTIGSLQDLGYSVDYSKADPYILQPAGIVIDPILSGIFLNANQTSSSNDILIGTTANDSLAGMAGNDSLYGLTGDDILRGGLGNDLLDAGTGDDLLTDIKGNNTLLGGTGNDILRAGAGNDLLDSGTDNDLLISDSGNDTLNGGTGNDTLNSGSGNDLLDGGTGDDYLLGGLNRDVLLGNTGDDLLIGGLGKDSLTGGTGADTFIYRATLESAINANRDVITDFISSDGDKIDTSAIDANTSSDGFQNFSYINNLSFTQPAQIQFNPVSHIIAFNTDNDIAPEMTILLLGVTTFNASDFLYGPK